MPILTVYLSCQYNLEVLYSSPPLTTIAVVLVNVNSTPFYY